MSGSASCGLLKFRQKKQQKNATIVAKYANVIKILLYLPFFVKNGGAA